MTHPLPLPIKVSAKADCSLPRANLPPRCPCPMPIQEGARLSDASGRLPLRQFITVILWRFLLGALTLTMTTIFTYEFYMVLSLKSITPAQIILLVLSVVSFTWVAFGSSAAICGFIASFAGVFRRDERLKTQRLPRRLSTRTALLFPVYHESPDRVGATIAAVAEECAGLGFAPHFDFFVLSDSRDDQARGREHKVFSRLRHSVKRLMPVYYRWRPDNQGKKAGNIAEWVRNYGGAYDHFVIFDADSIMTGETLARLVAAMEANSGAGLIQTVPLLVGGRSLIAQLQQFAARVYGPLLAKGSALWHGRDSNYWGHNAIIRCRAFASSAGLPELAGRPPFGGSIQSHDFIEAAFLRRAGWGVHLMPELDGSYEGCPPGIYDIIIRDRRWCQGNLQHARLLAWPDLKFVSRLHLVTGIMSYLASLFWLMALMAGLVTAYQWLGHRHDYFPDEVVLFPNWPVMDSERAIGLMIFTAVIVLLPKVLGLIYALFLDRAFADCGARLKLLPGFIIEVFFSALIAPIFMLAHVGVLYHLFTGRSSGWGVQVRDESKLLFKDAFIGFSGYSAVGLGLMIYCFFVSAALAGWLALIYAGLILAPVLAWLMGLDASRLVLDWLLIPEERRPKPVLLKSNCLPRQTPVRSLWS